jgi:hypothetical protein
LNTPENRTKVKAFIRDGCSTNTAAINMIRHFGFSHMMDIKCISHASSNVGKVLHESCKLGTKFVHRFNKMMNVSSEARKVFRELISTEVKRYTSDIRWLYIQEVSSQVFKFWPRVIELINNTDSFSKEIRAKLKNMIEDNEKDIRLELALFEDAALPLARLCYFQEGDGFYPLQHMIIGIKCCLFYMIMWTLVKYYLMLKLSRLCYILKIQLQETLQLLELA